ncbi:MAG: hypothetical protein Q9164_007763, partial [Protoblastenia rupestris]
RPRERVEQSRLSIIKSADSGEDWAEEAVLPKLHARGIYAAAWSQRTGRVVSTGGDGMVVVYQEEWVNSGGEEELGQGEQALPDNEVEGTLKMDGVEPREDQSTRWRIIAQVDAAHGVYEVNHVTWAKKPRSRQLEQEEGEEEELIITTGDDGAVKVWELKT